VFHGQLQVPKMHLIDESSAGKNENCELVHVKTGELEIYINEASDELINKCGPAIHRAAQSGATLPECDK